MPDPKNKRVHLQFTGDNNGVKIGSWPIPDPNSTVFLNVASDIGWHVAYAISRGATGCRFILEDEVDG